MDKEKGKNLADRRPRTCSQKSPVQEMPHHFTRAEKEAQATANFYHSRFPDSIKEEVDQMEVAIREKGKNISNEQIQEEFEGWFQGPRFSRKRDTKIFRITEMYWMTKALFAQVVEKRNLQQQVILHKIDLLDGKFEAVFKAVYGVDIVVSQPQHGNNNTIEMKEGSPGSVGTQSNPICIEADPLASYCNSEGTCADL